MPVVDNLHWSMAVIANLDTLRDRWQRNERALTEIKAGAEDEGEGSPAKASDDEGSMVRNSGESSAVADAAHGLKQRHACIVFMETKPRT